MFLADSNYSCNNAYCHAVTMPVVLYLSYAPAIQALHVLAQVDGISTRIPEQYPTLFKGLGPLKGISYTIQVKPDAKPFALFTLRNVPLPPRKKVQDELAHMESLGVISRVE